MRRRDWDKQVREFATDIYDLQIVGFSEFGEQSGFASSRIRNDEDQLAVELRRIGNEYGATTGRERRCGWFDAVLVRRAAMVNGLTHLCITKMDVMDSFEEIQICAYYELDGKRIEQFPCQISEVEKVKPVWETLPGWKSSTAGITRWQDLPENAQKYLSRLSQVLEVPLGLVSLGPKRHQTIAMGL